MKLSVRVLLAALFCCFGLGSFSQGAEHIQDNLGMFSDRALQLANQQIDQLYKNHGWMIAVETRDAAATIPNLPRLERLQGDFLTSWTTEQYKSNRLHGIYLVIFNNPTKFRFHVDTDLESNKIVTQADKTSWENLIEDNLRSRNYDLALLSAVGNMSNKLSRTNAADAKPATVPAKPEKVVVQKPIGDAPAAGEQAPSMMNLLLLAGGAFLLFMLFRSMMRGMANRQGYAGAPSQQDPRSYDPRENDPRDNDQRFPDPRFSDPRGPDPRYSDPRDPMSRQSPNMGSPSYPGGSPAPSQGGRGGGILSGILGGLFGGMAGNAMQDRGAQARGDEHLAALDRGSRDVHRDTPAAPPASSAETDATTHGGDWGNDAGHRSPSSGDSSRGDSTGSDSSGSDSGRSDAGGGNGGGDW